MKGENIESDLISDLQDLIIEKKELDRISWDNLGALIGYSGVGLKKAIGKKSLSLTHIEEIIIKLGLTKQAQELGMKLSGRKPYVIDRKNEKSDIRNFLQKDKILKNEEDLEILKSMCFANWTALLKKEDFKDKIKLASMKDIDKILDERLAIILKNMKN